MDLLTLAAPTTEFPRHVLDSKGGFLWWYLDLIDQDGNGCVVIWSYGLPFLPGYASAGRAGTAPASRTRPSLNVAVYQDWELDCYLLHEFQPDEVTWESDQWRFGDTHISVSDEPDARTLRLELDAPLPAGGRLQGVITAEGPRRWSADTSLDVDSADHAWAPQTCRARGQIQLSGGGHEYIIEGDAYFDGNYGVQPLGNTLKQWCWGRIPLPDRELVYYVLEGFDGAHETHAIELLNTGELKRLEAPTATMKHTRSLAGLRYPDQIELRTSEGEWLSVRAGALLDDGPFYVRHQITTSDGAHGIGEFCQTDRIDLTRHRPLVRMRVQHSVARHNSMWLPLFTGPRHGRLGALVSHWASFR